MQPVAYVPAHGDPLQSPAASSHNISLRPHSPLLFSCRGSYAVSASSRILVYRAITTLYAYQDSLHLRAILANIIALWDYEFCIRLDGSSRANLPSPSRILLPGFYLRVILPRSLSFLPFLLLSIKIRAYVNIRNLVLLNSYICLLYVLSFQDEGF